MKNGEEFLVFDQVKIYPEDREVLENVIGKHLRELLANYKGEYHHDLVIAGLTRVMNELERNIETPRLENREGYDVVFTDHKKTPS